METIINKSLQKAAGSTKQLNQPVKQESTWQKLINGITRPPRSHYRQTALGTRSFVLNEIKYERKETEIMHKGKKIMLTSFQPEIKNEWIILYLHGNSSSKVQAISIIKYLPFRFSLASFDFIGCGNNHQEDTITLGVRQAEQVKTVVSFLTNQQFRVVVWGRSMGAATALKFGKAPIIVADSSFSSIKSLCKQKAMENAPKYMPNCLICCIFPCVYHKLRSDVQQKAGYDLNELDIIQDIKKISEQTMIIFLNGDEDKLIDKFNSQCLYNSFKGKKKYLEIFKGTHNTKRPEETLRKVMRYIARFIDEQQSTIKEDIIQNQVKII